MRLAARARLPLILPGLSRSMEIPARRLQPPQPDGELSRLASRCTTPTWLPSWP